MSAGRGASRSPLRCVRRSRRLSGGIKTARNGAACRPIWWRAAQTFICWSKLGVWERLLERVQERGVELGMAFLNGSGAPPGGGGRQKGGSGAQRDVREALGRSRGGYGTKACVITDGAGRAISFALAPGQAHELPLAEDLVDCLPDIPGVGDKGYASHAFRQFIWDQAGDPDQEKRSARDLPRVDLQQSQPRRAPVGAPQGMARCRNPLRENRPILHGRALPCRHLRLDQERLQAITGPSITVAFSVSGGPCRLRLGGIGARRTRR